MDALIEEAGTTAQLLDEMLVNGLVSVDDDVFEARSQTNKRK